MKNTILTVLCVLAGLMLLNSGVNKFTQHMELPAMSAAAGALMGAFAKSGWMFPLIAIAEIIGAILLMIPKTRALGAIVLFPVLIGINLVHLVNDPSNPVGIAIGLILFAVVLWAMIDNKHKYMPMIS